MFTKLFFQLANDFVALGNIKRDKRKNSECDCYEYKKQKQNELIVIDRHKPRSNIDLIVHIMIFAKNLHDRVNSNVKVFKVVPNLHNKKCHQKPWEGFANATIDFAIRVTVNQFLVIILKIFKQDI